MIRIAHSPDADDAFMFYPLVKGRIDADIRFEHVLGDIETLNQKAMEGEYEVSAISLHAYPYVAGKYALLSCGGSVGYKYGPVVVSRECIRSLRQRVVAIPGLLTTAYLALRLFERDFRAEVVRFDRILDEVAVGRVDAGVLIHEGQLLYGDRKLHKLVDLGEWWYEEARLPLPLGGIAVRRDLGEELIEKIARSIRESVKYALEHRKEALEYALNFAGGLEKKRADMFIGMYVNKYTLDYGEDGRKAVELLLSRGCEEGIITKKVEVDFV